MKSKSLFVRSFVAISAAGSLVGSFGTAYQSAKADNLPAAAGAGQVNILTPSTQNFLLNTNASSPSTIQYNGSQGQNNNFAVGTGTSFGVSASSSSTPDYSVASKATFGSDTGTTFTNQIGTSGAASASNSFATTASEAASRSVDYQATQAWNVQVKAADGTVGGKSQSGWEAEWKMGATGKQAYSDAFKSAYTSIQQGNSQSSDANGTISGAFNSTQSGSGSNSASGSSATKVYVQENGAYREAVAADYKASIGKVANFSVATATAGVYAAASTDQINTAATAALAASATSQTTNSVTVKGIGADATFKAASTTKFDTDIKTNLGVAASTSSTGLIIAQGSDGKISSSGTANGSANGNFGTNSTASSNSATYSSVFYQAF